MPLGTASERSTCDYCEAHVTPEFRRIYGTKSGRAKRCSECDSWPRIEKGSAFQSWLNRYGAELIEAGERGHPGRIKIEAVLSRFRVGSGEYIGKVLDYLEVCWARADFDESLDGTVVEYNTGDGYDQIVLGSSRDARIR